ncbi:ZN418 protein, partial [Chloropsis cyanopogon]|nr:ZN418 protein [Chloropsis cyanopogon]
PSGTTHGPSDPSSGPTAAPEPPLPRAEIPRGPSRFVPDVAVSPRPYPCGQCGKSFARPTHLRSHQRTHTG